ncbi:MAG: DNA mismatch repair endonuclease MutL [Firmicutes bacterium]|nr:DNA mismatch repair endonuclease MutL [Bacillota bacterium]
MIKVLDSFIADKIAAGEVIERPVSIVKELVENSVDANASSIIVEIRNGGKSYIRVTDNGCGIPADELETAFLRHATGKISTLDDLNNIETLGFRGEALASISAVSRLTVVTRDRESSAGTKLTMHGGQKVSKDTVGANQGTTLIVEDVFYNIPARRKFMASDAREAAAIIDLIQKLAIYYSNISFRLINNGQNTLSTEGDGDYAKTIRSIYPTKEFRDLIRIEADGVHGFISNPGVTKTNRRGQIFFVNGRIVSSKVIETGIIKGYGDRVFSGFPITIIFLDVEPQSIDVNIHPGKKQVKFLYEDDVVRKLAAAISSAMASKASIPSADVKAPVKEAIPVDKPVIKEKTEQLGMREFLSKLNNEDKPVDKPVAKPATETKVHAEPEKLAERKPFYADYKAESKPSPKPIPQPKPAHVEEPVVEETAVPEVKEEILIEEKYASSKPFSFAELKYAGYFFNAYILMQAGENLYILDQHAAHERVFYEKLVDEYNRAEQKPQPILTPIIIETSQDVYNKERDWMEALCRMGYDIEDFGAGSFIIKGIPEFMSLGEAHDFASTYIEDADSYSRNSIVIDKLITKSCKSAVKANDALSNSEIRALLDKLSECRNPFSCPHGRPTFVKVSKYEIERAFRRK